LKSNIRSSSETVKGSALSLKSIYDIECGDGLSLGVLGVADGISDNVLEEASEDNSGLVIDERADSLDSTSSGESSDSWLGDTKDGFLDSLGGVSLSSGFTLDLAEFASFSSLGWCHFG
jgi:hypothetical protein